MWTFATIATLLLGTEEWPWPESRAPESYLEVVPLALKRLLLFLPKAIIMFLPKRVHVWTWYTVRLVSKLAIGLQRKQPRGKKPQNLHPKRPKRVRSGYEEISTEQGKTKMSIELEEISHPLARLLFWDMLILIAQDLHYSDIISLSLTSKQMRNTILPSADRLARLERLKKHTLDSHSKLQCDICGAPVCEVSSTNDISAIRVLPNGHRNVKSSVPSPLSFTATTTIASHSAASATTRTLIMSHASARLAIATLRRVLRCVGRATIVGMSICDMIEMKDTWAYFGRKEKRWGSALAVDARFDGGGRDGGSALSV